MDKNNVDTAKELPTVISFCSGYGGIERGLDLAGVKHRVLAYVEIEAFAIANLVNKMENGLIPPAPIYTDLKTFPAHLFRDCVDILTGGYPCQPFSAAGKRLGTEDPRHLWPYILDHINAIRPVRCFFENVEGHISLGLREVIDDLEGAGYSATWGIFSAAEVGAPHQRKRVYILGSNRDWDTNCIDDSQKQGISQGQDSQPSGVCTDVADTRDPRPSRAGIEPQPSIKIIEPCDSDSTGECGPDMANADRAGQQTFGNESRTKWKRDLLVNQVNWQTPVANDSVERAKGNYNSRGEPKLSAQVKNWPTPAARDYKGPRGQGAQERKGNPMDTLPNAVRNWPTPRAANPGSRPNGKGGKVLSEEVLISEGLRNRNEKLWPTPSAHEARLGYQDQSDPTKKGRQECTGHLNPAWVSWLMGIPADWTDLGDWE
jgi:DNA (cytosine-5)-methyltransferase 1